MVQLSDDMPKTDVVEAKKPEKKMEKHLISVDNTLQQVLKWDADGDELIFESDKGRFMELSAQDIQKLGHLNRVRYSVSRELNLHSDPGNDALQQRIKVTAANERRKQFESVVHTTNQSARATKKLQAFVGEGYEPIWSRTDKIEERIEKGYEIVKPESDVYAGVKATDGHFETRVRPGETELVLMRIRREDRVKMLKDRETQAIASATATEKRGENELKAMGAPLLKPGQGGAWQDRA